MRKIRITKSSGKKYEDTGNDVKEGDICWLVDVPQLGEKYFFQNEENAKEFYEIINIE